MNDNAWGRWGKDDERGALNLIGPDQVRRASTLVKTGEVLRLAQLLSGKTLLPPHRCGMQLFMNRDGGDYAAGARAPGGFKFAEDTVIMPLHFGTHIDALCHAWTGDEMYNGYLGNAVRSVRGAERLGVEKMPPMVTRGLFLDMVQHKGHGEPLHPGTVITRADLQAACAKLGVTPERGDAILLRTGWLESQVDSKSADFNAEPGIDRDAAAWLVECEVALIGADNFAVEVLPFAPGTVFPVHQLVIRDYGMPLIEGLDVSPLVAAGRHEFMFMATALPIVGATGSPLVPVAVL